tara:strand:+ start:278 stop:559 length:282 start_codon:yes stop_codon:yes gene_type:complete
MKTTITAHLHYRKYHFDEQGTFELFSVNLGDSDGRTYVGPREVEVDVPENYDPRAQQIAALEKQKQKVMADFQKTVTEINARISNLQALEYTA